MDAKAVYIWDRCDEIHEYRHSAEECCKPDVWEEWQCGSCGKTHAFKELATACCADAQAQDISTGRCQMTQDMFEVTKL